MALVIPAYYEAGTMHAIEHGPTRGVSGAHGIDW